MKTSRNAEKPEGKRGLRHLSCLSCALEYFKWYPEPPDVHSTHKHKSIICLITQSHYMESEDTFKGLWVARAGNDLHVFTLIIRTESIRGLRKAAIFKLHESLFPPKTCSCSLLLLSSGFYVDVSTIKKTILSLCLLPLCTQLLKTSDA